MKPCRIALAGGGRWARVYASVLAKNPDVVGVTIVSPHNADGMRRWLAGEGLPYVVTAEQDAIECDAAIVVNAAADHEATTVRFLKARIPTLVEKPFALSAASATRLIELSQVQGTYLASALVFKFAPYLARFVTLLRECAQVRAISVTWTDPIADSRYGERKSYDPSLPIPLDVLPHIVSLLGALLPTEDITCRKVEVERAGTATVADLSLGGTPCHVRLARNASKRVRLIEAATDQHPCVLDFSTEPGWISMGGEMQPGDPDWGREPSPLARLVRSFLGVVAGELRDHRLDAGDGLLACQVADKVLHHYDAALVRWLEQASKTRAIDASDLAYAAAESGADEPSVDRVLAALERRARVR